MKRTLLALTAAFFSMTALAAPTQLTGNQQNNEKHVLSLLAQPISKQKQCAKLGYIGYQNSLSAVYMTGNHGNRVSPVKAYAWGLVAYHQILKTNNKKLINGQKKTVRFIAKKLRLSKTQKEKAKRLESYFIEKYGHSWPAPSAVMKMKNFPKPCNLQ